MRVLIFVAVAVALPACAAPQVSIELLPDAGVPAGTVVLGQVAHLHAADLDLMRKLVHLPVGRSPTPGNVSVLPKDALQRWVHRRSGLREDAIAWSGAEETRVAGVAAVLPGEVIARAALDAARAQLASMGRSGDVRVRMTPRDVALPGGEMRLEARAPDQASWARHAVVWVDVWAGGWFVRAVPVGLEVVPGEVRDRTEAADMPLASSARLEAMATAGEPLAVARGDWALMRSSEGAVTLESRVEVLQDGRTGQRVRVRQPGASGPVLARVVGRRMLELAP